MKISSSEALELLVEGNDRFLSGVRSVESMASPSKLRELAEKGQSPFAIALTCSDSRVPAEIIFDRGLGDLFVIRIAGNVISPSVIGSVEFAATSFGTPLVLVMGHSKCGAIEAAVSAENEGTAHDHTHIGRIVQKVRPSVRNAVRSLGRPIDELDMTDLLHHSTIENVKRSATLLTEKSPVLQGLVADRKLMVVGALYDLHTGRVNFDLTEREAGARAQGARQQIVNSQPRRPTEPYAFSAMAGKRKV